MMKAILGYAAAGLTILGAVLIPFVLIGLFTRGVASTGVRIDPVFSGGALVRTLDKGAYRVGVYEPVLRRSPLARQKPFVQLTWSPVSALPAHVADDIDVDGDGRADLHVVFDTAALRVDVTPLSARFEPVHQAGRGSFWRLIARVNDSIVVRAPMR
jgi:hypothetical protein